MNKIKFSHRYYKMPPAYESSELAQVLIINESEVSECFRDYDTSYPIAFTKEGNYPLPKGKLILLLLIANDGKGWLWCTMRRWTPEKEKYYRSKIGEIFEIEINEESR